MFRLIWNCKMKSEKFSYVFSLETVGSIQSFDF